MKPSRLISITLITLVIFGLVLSPLLVSGQVAAAPPAQATPAGALPLGPTGGTFNCGGWTVVVPANVVPTGGLIHCGGFNPSVAPAAPAGYTLLRHTMNINIYDNRRQWITNFNPPITFCFFYNDAELAAAGGDVRNFNVLSAPIGGAWSALLSEGTPATRQVCARSNHLTLFDLATSGGVAPAVAATPAPSTAIIGYTYVTYAYGYYYTVQPGDTLFRIALAYNTTVYAIQLANSLPATAIYVGEVLLVPTNALRAARPAEGAPSVAATARPATTSVSGSRSHIVSAGENLFRIGLRYGVTVAAIQLANGLTSSTIYVGQRLIIPGK